MLVQHYEKNQTTILERSGNIMFSVRQKREISEAVQKILRDTDHSELPQNGEIRFRLTVWGADADWSFAEIQNNAAVTTPFVNPRDEINPWDER